MNGGAPAVEVLVPTYDEADRVEAVLVEIAASLPAADRRIVVLDDGSRDWPAGFESRLLAAGADEVRRSPRNEGKGAVLDRAFRRVVGRVVVVIDADGEYRGADIPGVVAPLVEGRAGWVLGSRYAFGRPRPDQYRATWLVNRVVTLAFAAVSGVRLHDLLTGLYALRGDLARPLRLHERRFAYTPELAWSLLRAAGPPAEVPVSYRFRGYGEGKKIRWWETATILAALIRYRAATDPTGAAASTSLE